MGRRAVAAALALGVGGLSGGCGQATPTPLADGCTASPEAIQQALKKAPGPVTLEDGSPLSRCVADGLDDGELQTVGITFSHAAENLMGRARTDPAAAFQLGFLTGVTRKGAARTNGVMTELVRRIEATAGRLGDEATPAARSALARGMAAGRRLG